MAAEAKLADNTDPIQDILKLLGTLGTGTTTERSSSEPGAATSNQADQLMKSIQESVNPDNMANLVQGILLKAKTALGPNIAASLGAGNRTVSDSSLASLQSEAQAKATAESAQAILDAQNNAAKLTTSLVNTKLNASRNQTQTSRTGVSPTAKVLGGLSLLNQGKRLFSNKDTNVSDATKSSDTPEQLSGPGSGYEPPASTASTDVIPSDTSGSSGFTEGDIDPTGLLLGEISRGLNNEGFPELLPTAGQQPQPDNPQILNQPDLGEGSPSTSGSGGVDDSTPIDVHTGSTPTVTPDDPSSGGGDSSAWIICTELNKQGKLPTRYYIYGARAFAKYPEYGKQAYYVWAIPCVNHLRRFPNSMFSRFLESIFNARAEYLAAKEGLRGAKKSLKGLVVIGLTYSLCWIISRFNPTPVNPLKELEKLNVNRT